MDRISVVLAPTRRFTDGDDVAGIEGTIVDQVYMNGVQEELVAGLIEKAGLTPDPNDNTQVYQALEILMTGRLVKRQVWAAAGVYTYTPSAGIKYVRVRVQGGGGAGGGATIPSSGLVTVGTSGASGAYAEAIILASALGASQTLTVGAGGAAVSGAAGNPGGTTSLGALVTAPGGTGGITSASVSAPIVAANGTPSAAPSFGTGATPVVAIYGASENLTVGMTAGNGAGAAGGRSQFGLGGLVAGVNAAGSSASNQGAGGGGVYAGSGLSVPIAGGGGAAGILILEEWA